MHTKFDVRNCKIDLKIVGKYFRIIYTSGNTKKYYFYFVDSFIYQIIVLLIPIILY